MLFLILALSLQKHIKYTRMNKYILSKYSHLFSDEGKYFLFNSQSLLFTEISENLYHQLNNFNIDLDTIPNKELLIKKEIFVEKEKSNEFYFSQKVKYYQSSFSQKVLSLTLLPTTGCNFACPYCFEQNKPEKFMTDEVISRLINFIREHKEAEYIRLTWYGGEPLLGFNIIQNIWNKLDNEIKIPVKEQSITTNGYLLTDEIINFFIYKKLNSIQITLDGKEDNHNKTRRLKRTGNPTYRQIVENIGKILNKWEDTEIKIRVNVEAEKCEDFFVVYNELTKLYGKDKMKIYPGFIRKDNKEKNNFDCGEQMRIQQQNLYLKLLNMGISNFGYPQYVEKGCMSNCINSYIIGPSGEIYKCWNDVGNTSRIIGYIDQDEFTNKDLFSKYMTDLSCFEDEKCKDCLFFPMCSGGCAWYRYRNKYENGKFDICTIQKNNDMLKKYLLAHYHHLLQKKEAV